jgi:anthranilate phosphoribosyltransferase
MFDRFTDRARKVMVLARHEAEGLKHDYIGTEHILLGLLKEDCGVAHCALDALGVTLEEARSEVRRLSKPTLGVMTMGQMPFTPRAKNMIEYAINEAIELRHNYVGTEHLLLGLARLENHMALEILKQFGLSGERVRQEVVDFLGAASPQPAPVPATPPSYTVSSHLERLLAREDLTPDAATELMEAIIAGRVGPVSVAAVAIALRAKGESVEELAAFARVMRERSVRVTAPDDALDTCGTGGDKSGTFNVSTATALVAAGMGIPVAKHGARSVSSHAGSADVLTELGVKIDVPPDRIARCITEAKVGFMFAPAHHPGMKHVAPVRKELGVRTCFNLLGPLSNPAGAKLQLLGVFEPSLCEKFARVLQLLGSRSAMIVCGAGPQGGYLDELSTFGPTTVARLKDGQITVEEVDARQLGVAVPAADALHAADAKQSAAIIREILLGAKGPARDIVVLNAAAAALVAGKADAWPEALRLAAESIDKGYANIALRRLTALTNE